MWRTEVEGMGGSVGELEGLGERVQRDFGCSGQEGKGQGSMGEEWVEGFGYSGRGW